MTDEPTENKAADDPPVDDDLPGDEQPLVEQPTGATDDGAATDAAADGDGGGPTDEDLLAEADAEGVDPEDEVQVDPRTADAPTATEADAAPVTPVPRSGTGWCGAITSLFRPRLTGAGALIAVLVGLLGFALIAQVQSNSSTTTLNNDRPEDLVRILSDLDARKDRLNTDISNLQDTQRQLESGAQGREAAIADAARRADELGILAGSIAAQGPGLKIHLAAGSDKIGAADVLDIVEELRGAGGEAMQIAGSNGTTVRIVASTYFLDADNGVVVDGQTLPGTLTLTAIGDPQTMQTALSIPGGALDTTKSHGGNVQIESAGAVQVTALHPATELKYARPTS